ncbi:hypothetical protein [Streptomyces sp. NPDC002172]
MSTDADVKSYASTVLGWHWGWKVDNASTGLPTLVRRKLLGNDKYLSGIESGAEVFKGSGRLDTTSYSVDIG